MAYSSEDKIKAAKELENARQAIRDRGGFGTLAERRRVEKAEKAYNKVCGKK